VPGFFTRIEVGDPHRFAQSIWENLPLSQKGALTEREFSAQEWAPVDRRHFRIEPKNYLSELSTANVGALRVSRTVSKEAMQLTLRSPGADGFAIWIIERGASQLIFPGSHEPAIANEVTGLIYRLEPGTHAIGSELQSRCMLRLPTGLPPPEARGSTGGAESRIYRIPADIRSDARRWRHDPPHVRLPVRRAGTFRYAIDE
jgi:hypothetical protein